MPQVTITEAKFVGEDGPYKEWIFVGTYDGIRFVVTTYDGQYDYSEPTDFPDDDDEPVQIAIGEFAEKNNLDLGKCHR